MRSFKSRDIINFLLACKYLSASTIIFAKIFVKNSCTFSVVKNKKILKLSLIYNKTKFSINLKKSLIKKISIGLKKKRKKREKFLFVRKIIRLLFGTYLKKIIICLLIKLKVIVLLYNINTLNYQLIFKKITLKNKVFKRFRGIKKFTIEKKKNRTIRWFYFIIYRKLSFFNVFNLKNEIFFIFNISHSKNKEKIKKLRRK